MLKRIEDAFFENPMWYLMGLPAVLMLMSVLGYIIVLVATKAWWPAAFQWLMS